MLQIPAYILRRLFSLIPVIIIVSIVVFGILHFTPGDPARIMLGELATEFEVETMRIYLGLDRPIHVQFWEFFSGIFRGDLGVSIHSGVAVNRAIIERLEPTVLLAILGLTLSILIGVPAGIICAVKRGSLLDQVIAVIVLFGISMPSFWVGMLLIIAFSVFLGWFPAATYQPLTLCFSGILSSLRCLILPAIAIGTPQAALICRITRSAMLDVLKQDYIRTAEAKGLSHKKVIYGHAFKNAFIPVLTVVGLVFAALLLIRLPSHNLLRVHNCHKPTLFYRA